MADIALAMANLAKSIVNEFHNIVTHANQALAKVSQAISFLQVIGMIVIIGRCIFAAITFIIEFFTWIFYFLKWLILPWPQNFLSPKRDDVNKKAGFIFGISDLVINRANIVRDAAIGNPYKKRTCVAPIVPSCSVR
jgi:hypothetical protein